MIDLNDSLGIPYFNPFYFNIGKDKDYLKEIHEILKFIKDVINESDIEELKGDKKHIRFINYGKTQLVFVLIIDNIKSYTLLVNQPNTKFGVGKTEFDNLNKLNGIDPNLVIKPIHYFNKDNRELYITPYHYQSRCIGVETTNWGVWKPEPEYNFKDFSESDKKIINSVMVASLIKLYDYDNNHGISKVNLEGGDFMLDKGYENEEINTDNILKNITLIAARELMPISLEAYMNRLRVELCSNNSNNIILGKNLKSPLNKDTIEDGIKLGFKLRNNF